MKIVNPLFPAPFLVAALVLISIPDHALSETIYQLQSGSKVTLAEGATEVLTGYLTLGPMVPLIDPSYEFPLPQWDVLALRFESASFSLRLDSSPVGILITPPEFVHLYGTALASGLPVATVTLSTEVSGFLSNSRLVFPEVGLSSAPDLPPLARLRLDAVAVPEPSTVSMLALGGLGALALARTHIRPGARSSRK
ncbi:MAG TPA: PEP-CTERM sorting domain-containing protein [Verrucomicrobiota bacterium]|nr:hypothetical protein [Verrucomicrobiales bacterium]HRI14042.1 PEP-CTERM sorting domain-containing protein [Verrucomicrobiota bacterium]